MTTVGQQWGISILYCKSNECLYSPKQSFGDKSKWLEYKSLFYQHFITLELYLLINWSQILSEMEMYGSSAKK